MHILKQLKMYETKAVCMFFKHIFGVLVWLVLVIRSGIKNVIFRLHFRQFIT